MAPKSSGDIPNSLSGRFDPKAFSCGVKATKRMEAQASGKDSWIPVVKGERSVAKLKPVGFMLDQTTDARRPDNRRTGFWNLG